MIIQGVVKILAVLCVLCSWIIFSGPTHWDRLQGLSVLSSKITLILVLLSVTTPEYYALDVALVYTLLGFISLMLIARFLDRRGQV